MYFIIFNYLKFYKIILLKYYILFNNILKSFKLKFNKHNNHKFKFLQTRIRNNKYIK